MHYVYILQCSDGTYYTGYTRDLAGRLKKHNEGKASRYTRGRLPVQYVYWEVAESHSQGLKREIIIKKMRRSAKEQLIQSHSLPFLINS